MLALLTAFALVTGPLQAGVTNPTLSGYEGYFPLAYDSHIHPANVQMVGYLMEADYDPKIDGTCNTGCGNKCIHSYRWCSDVYAEWKSAEVSALVSHHSAQVMAAATFTANLATWKTAGENFNPHSDEASTDVGWNETYPTSASGLPCSTCASGFTDDEVTSLYACAEDANAPGRFVAMYGIEYTDSQYTTSGCDSAGQSGCGGHKTAHFRTEPAKACHHSGAAADACSDESELYSLVNTGNGVVVMAHPTTSIAADFTAYVDDSALGGLNATHTYGTEFSTGSEDVDCSDVYAGAPTNNVVQCGYRQALAYNYQLYPAAGSDNHQYPASNIDNWNCANNASPEPKDTRRGICLVESVTRTGLMDAMQARRCYWAGSGFPLVYSTIEGGIMGSAPTKADTIEHTLHAERKLHAGPGAVNRFAEWELICGLSPADGTDGSAAIVDSGRCESGTLCTASGSKADASYTWCYHRIETTGDVVEVVTAAVVL